MPALAIDDAGFWTVIAQVMGALTIAMIGTLWLAGVLWVANDVRRRTTDQATIWLSIGAAALLFLPGVLLYIAFRPAETMDDRCERMWEMEYLAQAAYATPTCNSCRRSIREDYVRCPHCAASLGDTCSSCHRFNPTEWVACAYCGEQRGALTSRHVAEPQRATATAAAPPSRIRAMAAAVNGRAATR